MALVFVLRNLVGVVTNDEGAVLDPVGVPSVMKHVSRTAQLSTHGVPDDRSEVGVIRLCVLDVLGRIVVAYHDIA
jgi:hypothetical protein